MNDKANHFNLFMFVTIFNAIFSLSLLIFVVHQQIEITKLKEITSGNEDNDIVQTATQLKSEKIETAAQVENSSDNKEEINAFRYRSRVERDTRKKCCGKRKRGKKGDQGPRGPRGPRGNKGQKGPKGPKGEMGKKGEKGERGFKGNDGAKGAQGVPGAQGPPGVAATTKPTQIYAESAHLMGYGGARRPNLSYNRITRWLQSHISGGMIYNNGYLYVGYDGYYYIYSQMYYYAGDTAVMAHRMKIDDVVMLTGHSSASSTNKFNTNYIGGVFKLKKGQRISVSAPFTKSYYFHKHEAYFGAFLVHV